jgi:hypothetical protein
MYYDSNFSKTTNLNYQTSNQPFDSNYAQNKFSKTQQVNKNFNQ